MADFTTGDTLTEKHFIFTKTSDIIQISQPLMEFLGLNYFAYRRIKDNGVHLALTTCPEWVLNYYHKQYYKKREVQKSTHNKIIKPVVWDFFEKDPFSLTALKESADRGFFHSLSIVKSYNGYMDLYSFAAPENNTSVSENYLIYFDYIIKFMKYFEHQAQNIIAEAQKHLILTNQAINLDSSQQERELNYLNSILIKNLKFKKNINSQILTRRETALIALLLEGRNTSQIASLWKLSSRTIEKHIDNIKKKTNFRYKTDLVNFFGQYKDVLQDISCSQSVKRDKYF